MAEESEMRFHAVMVKLFHAPPPSSKSADSTSVTTGGLLRGRKRPLAVVDSKSKGGMIEELRYASGATVQAPMCRPWDREDLLKRLATFKSMTWFAKPEVVSAINCARRGWVNVDMDIIACESCGARVLFSTPSSWSQQQVEKAASVFSLKLNNGHKLLCPWVDNACDEKLAQFPSISPVDLVDDYKKRSASLLQLLELPVISSTAIEYMRSPLLEHFLKSPSNVYRSDNVSARGSGDECEEVSPILYYQAQKLISLCGWEPRLLPYIVDCKNLLDQSIKDGTLVDSSVAVSNAHNASITVYSSGTAEKVEGNKETAIGNEQYDHTSVVLDCRLCGARVGLWAFCTTPRPAEFVRLTGHAEPNDENMAAPQKDNTTESGEQTPSTTKSGGMSSNRTFLNLTIAGGPPPAEQNFRPTISLPVVGQNLRTRFASAFGSADDKQPLKTLSHMLQETHEDGHHSYTNNGSVVAVQDDNGAHMSVGGDSVTISAIPATNTPSSPTSDQPENTAGKSSNTGDKMSEDVASIETVDLVAGDLHSSEDRGSFKTHGAENSTVNHATGLNNVSDTGKDSKKPSYAKPLEFDPIKQHRHFCPWITSSGKSAPGWKQTLSALERQKEFFYPSPTTQSSSSLIEVEDPVGSVKKLFTSPSAKRKKINHGST